MRKLPDNRKAFAAFIDCKTAIDTILVRLTAPTDEHFNLAPDELTWADVGTLGSYLEGLRQISDAAFREGEYAA